MTFILIIGLFNLILGFATAVALHQFGFRCAIPAAEGISSQDSEPRESGGALRPEEALQSPAAAGPLKLPLPPVHGPDDASEEGGPDSGKADDAAPPDAMTPEWEETLRTEAVSPSSAAEAAVWVLRIEVRPYREHLVFAERRLRQGGSQNDVESVTRLLADLREVNASWAQQLVTAASILESREDVFPGEEELDQPLAHELRDQIAQIQTAQKTLDKIKLKSDLQTGGKRTLAQVCQLIQGADSVRDHLNGFLGITLRAEDRLRGLDRRLQLDRMTELYNRVGLECVFDQWRHDEKMKFNQLTIIEIDIDRFSKLNAALGHLVGDQIIKGIGELLQELMRQNRGYDRVARTAGQAFCLFLGETDAEGAVCAAERMRQVIEATSFELDDFSVEMTVSCAVVEIDPDESIYSVLRRLRSGIKEAKRAGRNRTFKDDLVVQEVVEPLPYQVKARVITLDDSQQG